MIRSMGFRKDFFGVSGMRRILGPVNRGVKTKIGRLFPIFAVLFTVAACQTSQPVQSVDVTDIPPPPPIRFDATPSPTLLPHTNLYLFLSSDRPVYYRDGQYFQNWEGNWFMSNDLRGPWTPIIGKDLIKELPDLLVNVPPDYYYENFPYKLRKDQ